MGAAEADGAAGDRTRAKKRREKENVEIRENRVN